MQIILASQSPYRRALLENFGIPFETQSPAVDEEALKAQGPSDPVELSQFLARKKAESLVPSFPRAVILGCDQLVDFQGERLDKPGSIENALNQLRRMQGHSHRLITSLVIVTPLKTVMATDIATIHLRKMSDHFLELYLKQDQPLDCAGAYKIERAGLSLIEKLEAADPSAIQGLPLIAMTRLFDELGLRVSDMWSGL